MTKVGLNVLFSINQSVSHHNIMLLLPYVFQLSNVTSQLKDIYGLGAQLLVMIMMESGSFRPDDLFAPGRFAPLTCSPRVVSPRKVSRFAPLNCYYIIIDEVFFDNFLIIIYLLASCCGFSYYYRFSDIAISSVTVNPSFI